MHAAIQQTVDQMRAISLEEFFRWHGFKVTKGGVSFRAKSKKQNIVITGVRWFDNKTGLGGASAIDLQMHLWGRDFQTTCHALAESFRAGAGIAFPPNKNFEPHRQPFEEFVARYALPSTGGWPIARDYLVQSRKIDQIIVDDLHDLGSIYANNHRPNLGIVFLHRSGHGKVADATLRDTRHESSFRPCLGNKLTAWFSVGDLANAQTTQSNPSDTLGFARSFLLPTAVPSSRLWSGRICEFIPGFPHSKAAGINPSPVCALIVRTDLFEPAPRSSVMQDSDFPGGNHIGLFFAPQKSSLLRVSGTLRKKALMSLTKRRATPNPERLVSISMSRFRRNSASRTVRL